MVNLVKIFLLLTIFNTIPIFSQEKSLSFFGYNLGTELSQILEVEGNPDKQDNFIEPSFISLEETFITINIICYYRNINGNTLYYEYIFDDNRLSSITVTYIIEKEHSIQYYENIYNRLYNDYDSRYTKYYQFEEYNYVHNNVTLDSYLTIWSIDNGFISLRMEKPENGDIEMFVLYISNSLWMPDRPS